MATDWIAIRTEFVHGAMTLRDIAKAKGLNESTVRNRAKKEKWQQERDTTRHCATQRADAALVETKAGQLAKWNQDDIRLASAIRQKVESMLEAASSPSDVKALAGAHDTAQKVGRLALGVETENSVVRTQELPASVDDFV